MSDEKLCEDGHEDGLYLTQSGYLVWHKQVGAYPWHLFNNDLDDRCATIEDLKKIYGESEFPLIKCDRIKYGYPNRVVEPTEDGVYLTQSGKLIWRRSNPYYYRWMHLAVPSYCTDKWEEMVMHLGRSEFPLRKFNGNGFEPVGTDSADNSGDDAVDDTTDDESDESEDADSDTTDVPQRPVDNYGRGFYLTQSGRILVTDGNVLKSWLLMDAEDCNWHNFRDLVDRIGAGEFPLRKITQDDIKEILGK